MKTILTDKMMQEIFTALERGETFNYSNGETEFSISPNGISIQYKSAPSTKDRDIKKFMAFCDSIHEDLFVEVCETFADGELEALEKDLDTDNYQNTIKVFTTRVGEVANNKLTEICNAADVEIRRQELIIKDAQAAINDIHSELDKAITIYSI